MAIGCGSASIASAKKWNVFGRLMVMIPEHILKMYECIGEDLFFSARIDHARFAKLGRLILYARRFLEHHSERTYLLYRCSNGDSTVSPHENDSCGAKGISERLSIIRAFDRLRLLINRDVSNMCAQH